MAEEIATSNTDPSNFLSNVIGSSVVVKLHNGVEYSGNLQSIDGYMNIVLDDGKELVGGREIRNYGDVFIRGNNVRRPPEKKERNGVRAEKRLKIFQVQCGNEDSPTSKFFKFMDSFRFSIVVTVLIF
ncbi:hypothetical protein G9P44_003110 [Scheffersomyces stipitis]|nr:hypothetical protein G9P44_003110 [Scheffersomyces stipitis]